MIRVKVRLTQGRGRGRTRVTVRVEIRISGVKITIWVPIAASGAVTGVMVSQAR